MRRHRIAAPLVVPVLLARAFVSGWRHRVHGLGAETAFWTLVSLAPLLLGLLGAVGYLAPIVLEGNVIPAIEERIITAASGFFTPSALENLIKPLVHGVLAKGRTDAVSIGFVIAFWTGSTALGCYLNAIAIAYGQRGLRGIVHTRLLAIGLYVLALLVGVVFLPLLVIGPRVLTRLLPSEVAGIVPALVRYGYWPVVALIALTVILVLYRVGVPRRIRWRHHLPGAVLAVGVWIGGSYALRVFLQVAFGQLSTYGPLATPIAALMFFYVSALAVLFGAELNAQLLRRRGHEPEVRKGDRGPVAVTGGDAEATNETGMDTPTEEVSERREEATG